MLEQTKKLLLLYPVMVHNTKGFANSCWSHWHSMERVISNWWQSDQLPTTLCSNPITVTITITPKI